MTSNLETRRLDHYSIFTGVFLYAENQPSKEFVPWSERLISPQILFSYLKKTYYETYFNTIVLNEADQKSPSSHAILHHETRREILQAPLAFGLKAYPDQHFQISWFDRYLFSERIGIYCFKVEFANNEGGSYQSISELIRHLRDLDCEIICGGKAVTVNQLIHDYLSPGLSLLPGWDKHVTKLKHYTIVNENGADAFDENRERILFELAHAMPLGTVSAKSSEKPTVEYYHNVFRESSIAIYANWKALSLLDSFTRLSIQFPDAFLSWELDYFHIYIYCLYCKYHLHDFGDKWKDASQSKKKAALLKEEFLSFISDHSSATISHKFLPNLLFEKMSASMEIRKELEAMERKMGRITEVAESKVHAMNVAEEGKGSVGSAIIAGFNYDIYISYRPNDNKLGWITEFVKHLQDELASTLKDRVNIYFDKEQGNGLLETRQVSKSMEGKLNCLILIPIVSHTYCDTSSLSWQHELVAFNRLSGASNFGREIRLKDGNVSSRILPVCIHELDEDDRRLIEKELSMALRSVDFIYQEPGVNRPLKPDDDAKENLNKTSYRNQLNKLANAIGEVVKGMIMSKKEN